MDPSSQSVSAQQAINATLRWLERAVIGLNLCPFAKAPHIKGRIRIVACIETDIHAWLNALTQELQDLVQCQPSERETTLLVIPNALRDFAEFNDCLEDADLALQDLDLEGVIQIASFHPQYQFAGTQPDDITNYTNRSPYPVLHLIREESIDRAVAVYPHAEAIYETNIRTLRDLGIEGWSALDVGPPA